MKVVNNTPAVMVQPTVTIQFSLGEAFNLVNEVARQAEATGNYSLVNSFWDLEHWVNGFTKEEKEKAFWEWRG